MSQIIKPQTEHTDVAVTYCLRYMEGIRPCTFGSFQDPLEARTALGSQFPGTSEVYIVRTTVTTRTTTTQEFV